MERGEKLEVLNEKAAMLKIEGEDFYKMANR